MTGMTLTRGDKRLINSISISLKLSSQVVNIQLLFVVGRQEVFSLSPVTSGGDEVKQSVNAVILESSVSFDSRLFAQNVVALFFQIIRDRAKCQFVVDVFGKSRSITDRETHGDTVLL